MHGALATLGLVVTMMASVSNAFVVPGPSQVVSGRSTRASTSQVIVMGRGDTRTTKGKRMRHSYGKSRPQKQKEVVYFEGEIVKKAAPVARRWENIEYDEASMPKPAPVEAAAEEVTEAEEADSAVEEEAAAPDGDAEEAVVEEEAAPAAE
ncbi:unnamed protein product [Ectocarpus sp. 12 AP-2014]